MLRRWLYGIFLTSWSLHGHVAAAAEPPKKPKSRSASVRSHAEWESAGDAAQVHVAGVTFANTLVAAPHRRIPLPGDEVLFTAHFDMDARNMIRSGIDLDVNLVGVASLQLKVAGSSAEAERGRRWAFGTGGGGPPSGKSCSLAANVDFVQVAPYGTHKLVFVPQLNMALDTMVGAPAGMTAAVRYGHWTQQALDDKGTVGSQVPQLFLRWSF